MAQAAEVPQALVDRIHVAATEALAYTNANETEANKAANAVRMQNYMTDPNYKDKMMARMTAEFTTADANGDGVLNRAEYGAWMASF